MLVVTLIECNYLEEVCAISCLGKEIPISFLKIGTIVLFLGSCFFVVRRLLLLMSLIVLLITILIYSTKESLSFVYEDLIIRKIYWSFEELNSLFELQCQKAGISKLIISDEIRMKIIKESKTPEEVKLYLEWIKERREARLKKEETIRISEVIYYLITFGNTITPSQLNMITQIIQIYQFIRRSF